ncbi:FAD-linked oxidase [Halobacteriales archaeon QS_1_69_70]|nr:MAG: FAD-linked oxidase [Halobacteriales archaeon QS_1_69_70]
MSPVDPASREALAAESRGTVLVPGDPGYDAARSVWNARVDRRPDAVLRCRGAADVAAGVSFARDRGLALGVKGGGHHVSGAAVPDGGLLVDLSPMDRVRVDPAERVARVGPGGDVDPETQAHGLAVPGGQDPNIGVGGLTLGGGVGWLSRQHGLTCDNLLAADVVTADGDLRRATETELPDLFWALRGGGGQFGVVTEFTFRLHEVGPTFPAGSLVYPADRTAAVARYYREFVAEAPRAARPLFGSMILPVASAYPESVRGERVAIIIVCYAGPPAAGRRALEPLRERGDPVMDSLRPRPYVEFQRAGDSEGARRTALRSQYMERLGEDAIGTIVAGVEDAPSDGATVFVSPRGGAETDPTTDATAYPHRSDAHHCLVEARWDDPPARRRPRRVGPVAPVGTAAVRYRRRGAELPRRRRAAGTPQGGLRRQLRAPPRGQTDLGPGRRLRRPRSRRALRRPTSGLPSFTALYGREAVHRTVRRAIRPVCGRRSVQSVSRSAPSTHSPR